jgi:hypothetical protein
MYVAIVDCATLNPSLSSSPWMRGAPKQIFYAHPALRLECRDQYGQNEADQRDHHANLADSIIR